MFSYVIVGGVCLITGAIIGTVITACCAVSNTLED